MLEVRELRKRFRSPTRGEVVAVDGLSFQVAAGEVYGLLGPNGAGKTTTLRILATLTKPTAGGIVLEGTDALAQPLRTRARMAYVPAEVGLPDRLSPREVVTLFARIQGVSGAAAAAEALLERLGATPYAHTPCGDLSTGMKRRVVLARALVHEPELLLLDEPTDGLDVPGRREVLDLVREQAAAGRAVVISSHILAEVQRVADRVGVMSHGRLLAEGTVGEVLQSAGATDLDEAFLSLLREDDA